MCRDGFFVTSVTTADKELDASDESDTLALVLEVCNIKSL